MAASDKYPSVDKMPKEGLPTDYEVCGVCGFDHAYDLPYLDAETRVEVLHLHLDNHPIPPYDLIVSSYRPGR